MTAHSGRGWRLAPSLVAMEAEADRIAPRRSKRSDGSIGDRAHASRASDHNISGGIVHALDLTHDPAGGWDAHGRARQLAERRDPRIKYLISSGRIWTPSGGWRRYVGENRHDAHAHFSVFDTTAAETNIAPWWSGAPAPPPANPGQPPPSRPKEKPMIMRRYPDGSIWLHEEDGILRSRVPTNEDANVLKILGVPFDDYSGNPNAAKTLLTVTRDIDAV